MLSEYLSAHMIMSCFDISQKRRHVVYSEVERIILKIFKRGF